MKSFLTGLLAIIFSIQATLAADERNDIMLSLWGGYYLPQGEFTRIGFEPVMGGNFSVEYLSTDEFGMFFSLGYSSWENNNSKDAGANTYTNIPLTVGLLYYPNFNLPFFPYGGAELGYHFINMDYAYEQYDETNTTHWEQGSETAAVFGWSLCLGALYPLNDRFSVNLNMKYNMIDDQEGMRLFARQYYGAGDDSDFIPNNYKEAVSLIIYNIGISYYL